MTILGVETAAPFIHWMKVLKWHTYQVRQVETAQGAETARNIYIKLASADISNRLKSVLLKLIFESQTGFPKG